MSFDLSVPKITFIFYPTEEQVWEFWDVFLILLFFFWKEDEEQDLDWEAHPLRGHHLRGHPLRGFPIIPIWNPFPNRYDGETPMIGFPFPNHDIITPFRRACEKGDSEKVATLLKSGEHGNENDLLIAPRYTDNMLNITMIWACKHGDVEVVNILLNKGAIFKNGIDYLMTPLQYACKYGHSDVAKVLLENGADVKDSVYYHRINGAPDHSRTYYHRINGAPDYSRTAMLLACENGHADVVNVLLDNGADVNENLKQSFYYDPDHDFSRYNTPLYISWMSAHSDVWKLLIERGANIDLLW
jgi:ankyrin repeat protein